jgi:hypothetical protein
MASLVEVLVRSAFFVGRRPHAWPAATTAEQHQGKRLVNVHETLTNGWVFFCSGVGGKTAGTRGMAGSYGFARRILSICSAKESSTRSRPRG